MAHSSFETSSSTIRTLGSPRPGTFPYLVVTPAEEIIVYAPDMIDVFPIFEAEGLAWEPTLIRYLTKSQVDEMSGKQ